MLLSAVVMSLSVYSSNLFWKSSVKMTKGAGVWKEVGQSLGSNILGEVRHMGLTRQCAQSFVLYKALMRRPQM